MHSDKKINSDVKVVFFSVKAIISTIGIKDKEYSFDKTIKDSLNEYVVTAV